MVNYEQYVTLHFLQGNGGQNKFNKNREKQKSKDKMI